MVGGWVVLMSDAVELEGLSRNEVLDLAGALYADVRKAEAQVLVLAVRFALLNGAVPIEGAKPLPGRAGLKQLGGAATPTVAEFAPVMLGARLGLSAYAGARLIADALDLYYRLPCLWQRVHALEVKASYAREVARKTRHLAKAHAKLVDQAVAEEADGRLPWTRFIELLDASIITADPATAAKREEEAGTRLAAAPTRSNEYGLRGFFVHAPFPVIARLDATVTYLAQALLDFGDTASLDERRVKAVLILANPTQAVHVLRAYATWRASQNEASADAETAADLPVPDPDLDGDQHCSLADVDTRSDRAHQSLTTRTCSPTVRLFVHLSQDTIDNDCTIGVARVEGQPPITAQWVKQHLGGCRITVTPVLDLANQIPIDAWEIPRSPPPCRAPDDTCRHLPVRHQHHPQQTDRPHHPLPSHRTTRPITVGNYGPMTVFHHLLKTHGGWQVVQPFPGIYLWRDPTQAATYLVDHTGTRRLPPA